MVEPLQDTTHFLKRLTGCGRKRGEIHTEVPECHHGQRTTTSTAMVPISITCPPGSGLGTTLLTDHSAHLERYDPRQAGGVGRALPVRQLDHTVREETLEKNKPNVTA